MNQALCRQRAQQSARVLYFEFVAPNMDLHGSLSAIAPMQVRIKEELSDHVDRELHVKGGEFLDDPLRVVAECSNQVKPFGAREGSTDRSLQGKNSFGIREARL